MNPCVALSDLVLNRFLAHRGRHSLDSFVPSLPQPLSHHPNILPTQNIITPFLRPTRLSSGTNPAYIKTLLPCPTSFLASTSFITNLPSTPTFLRDQASFITKLYHQASLITRLSSSPSFPHHHSSLIPTSRWLQRLLLVPHLASSFFTNQGRSIAH